MPHTEKRLQGLDQLRAFAVFLVLCHHAAYRFSPSKEDFLANIVKNAGWIGVDIFFIISGFMISKILVRDIQMNDLRGFFIRRIYRIYPLLLIAVVLFLVVALMTGREADKISLLWSPALMLNGWTIPFIGYSKVPYTITWSLSVEETAYILLGLSCLWRWLSLQTMLVCMLALSVTARLTAVLTGLMDSYSLYFFVPARFDGIAVGGLAALGLFKSITSRKIFSIPAGVLTLCLIIVFQFIPLKNPIMPLFGYTVFALICGAWVACIAQSESLTIRARSNLPLRWLGKVVAHFGQRSYFIYLFHIYVLEWIGLMLDFLQFPPINYWIGVFLATMITYACACVSWIAFELPLIQLGRAQARKALQRKIDPQALIIT